MERFSTVFVRYLCELFRVLRRNIQRYEPEYPATWSAISAEFCQNCPGFQIGIEKAENRGIIEVVMHMTERPESRRPVILHDPVEDTPEYMAIKDEVEAKADLYIKQLKETRWREAKTDFERSLIRSASYAHVYWAEKKRILREDYGIEWKTPGEMNPQIRFD